MSARDVSVSFATAFLTEQWGRGEPLNPQAAHDLGVEWLAALDAAGYAVVPKEFSTNATVAIRDTVKPHIRRHDVRCDDGRVRLEIHIDFPEIYKVMLKAAKETT